MYTQMCVYTYVYVCMCIYIYIYIYAYTKTHEVFARAGQDTKTSHTTQIHNRTSVLFKQGVREG